MISLNAWIAAGAGLLFGSFLNVCIARLPQHRSIAWPGSHCPRCQAPIRAFDNVPLVSFLLLGGRCRSCRERIAWRYPLTEAALAVLWCACFVEFDGTAHPMLLPFEAAAFCFFALGLLGMDLETFLLPDSFTLPGAGLGLISAALPGGGLTSTNLLAAIAPFHVPALSPLAGSVLGLIAAPGVLMLIRVAYRLLRGREGMGLGDVKLAAMLGAWLGFAGVALSLVIGVLLGCVLAVAVVIRARTTHVPGKSSRVPLGAALCVGGLVELFRGELLLRWYFNFWR